MKKLMFTAAVAAAGGLMAIESANTVGFTTADVPKGEFGQLAVQFEKTGGGNATVDQLFKGEITGVEAEFEPTTYVVTSESKQKAAQIQVWTGSEYNYYYYFSNAWDPTLNDGEGGETTGWADGIIGEIATDTLAPGQAAWVKATTANTHIVQAGQVYDGSYEKSCPKGEFVMIANTMPTALDLNDATQIEFAGLTPVAADFDPATFVVTSASKQNAAQIQVWTGSEYVYYYYFSNAWDSTLNGGEGGEVTAWADGIIGEVVADKIPTGQGFWLKATTSATTVTINK